MRLVSDAMLDRFEALARVAGHHRRRAWERYFETLLIEAGSPDEARLVKGVFRYVERDAIREDQVEEPQNTP